MSSRYSLALPALLVAAGVVPLAAQATSGQCAGNPPLTDSASGAAWNGWGAGISNSRFQTANAAQLAPAQVPKLKLKWAFGLAGAKQVFGEPVVASGRVFFSDDTGAVYSLNAETGCEYWKYQAEAGVRTAVSVRYAKPSPIAYFGDLKANVYALDAQKGTLLWKVHADEHPAARVTGAPQVFEDRVYVPVASSEEGTSSSPTYPCCTFRGSVVALDAATGKQIWKTYTITDVPKVVAKNSNAVSRWAPAGGGVWNSPTIDPKRRALYIGTGDAYTSPAPETTDAIMALDLDSGKILWSQQGTANDAWVVGCMSSKPLENCPEDFGPDQDFGSPPILHELPNGRTLLVAGQKSGNVRAYDPDRKGTVVWRTALVNNTKEFGGKIVWGGAADNDTAYFGLGTGGIAAVSIRDGELKWFTHLGPVEGREKHPGQEGPLSAIPGVIFSGGWDGVLRALSAADGKVIWQFDTARDFQTVNGVAARGGSMGAAGPVVAGGMLLVPSGYMGVRNGIAGNVVLAFAER
ncbi:MAG TPA: PQQ-binding-like beta-propeller repeat protein [Bryobacteraceae bacterium]|nr:PQQ-binding-like beta-propeller repeat protein [Bryobacteraceae bacterium]